MPNGGVPHSVTETGQSRVGPFDDLVLCDPFLEQLTCAEGQYPAGCDGNFETSLRVSPDPLRLVAQQNVPKPEILTFSPSRSAPDISRNTLSIKHSDSAREIPVLLPMASANSARVSVPTLSPKRPPFFSFNSKVEYHHRLSNLCILPQVATSPWIGRSPRLRRT